ncbi:MAG: hypothetical protein AB7H96_05545 [Vicinamibacterales bacterium]
MSALATVALAMMMANGSVPPAAADPAAADASSRTVTVRLHDYAELDDDEVNAAQRQVSEIFGTIGVIVEWRTTVRPSRIKMGRESWPADPVPALTVLALTPAMARRIGIREDVAGYAAVSPQDGGSVAFMVAERTRRIAECARLSHARVAAGVIAHELAHLLMPNRPHAHDGLMRANWQPWDFRFSFAHAFSAVEGEIIRRGVARLARTAQHADN